MSQTIREGNSKTKSALFREWAEALKSVGTDNKVVAHKNKRSDKKYEKKEAARLKKMNIVGLVKKGFLGC